MRSASAPERRAGANLVIARVIALLTAASLACAAVTDNAVVCPDDADAQGEAHHGVPATPHACVTAPCHTPILVRNDIVSAGPATVVVEKVTAALTKLTGIDTPAPPTPPPTAFD